MTYPSDVIQRNFLRLLRSGTFGGNEAIEPMSAWKWGQLYKLSLIHRVAPLVFDGIRNHRDDFLMQIPAQQMGIWEKATEEIERANIRTTDCLSEIFDTLNRLQLRPILQNGLPTATLYGIPSHRTGSDIEIYFPYTPQARKADSWAKNNGSGIDTQEKNILRYRWHDIGIKNCRQMASLTNKLLNRRLQNIISSEIKCCDSVYIEVNGVKIETVPPTLHMLLLITRITSCIINYGICLKQIVDLGIFLRKSGDKIDFVKLQQWLRQLRMQQMAGLAAALLVRLFDFDEDEVPFADTIAKDGVQTVTSEIYCLSSHQSDDWYFTQGNNIFIRNTNSNAMLWHIRHSIKLFRFYPSELITNLFVSFAHSLSHIEE